MLIDRPPQVPERVVCSISAAARYAIPANIVLAVAEKENGRPGLWVRNSNGTHDLGALQFNTAYIETLARYGITPADVMAAGCYPYDLAAWRLRQHIMKDDGDLWTRAANYHSRTPRLNEIYRYDLMKRAAKWADWLSARYPTHDAAIAGVSLPGETTARPSRPPARLTTRRPASDLPRKLLTASQQQLNNVEASQ
jgi:hypothetical protein